MFLPCLNAAEHDYLPVPTSAVLTYWEGNMDQPLCKEIIIIDDSFVEGTFNERTETFRVQLIFVGTEGIATADVQFNPRITTVEIQDDDEFGK